MFSQTVCFLFQYAMAPEDNPEVELDVAPDVMPEYMPDVEPEYILEVVPDGMPDVTSEHMPDVVPDVEPDVIGRTHLRLMYLKYLTVHCIS